MIKKKVENKRELKILKRSERTTLVKDLEKVQNFNDNK